MVEPWIVNNRRIKHIDPLIECCDKKELPTSDPWWTRIPTHRRMEALKNFRMSTLQAATCKIISPQAATFSADIIAPTLGTRKLEERTKQLIQAIRKVMNYE